MIFLTTYLLYALFVVFLAGSITRRSFEKLSLLPPSTSTTAFVNTLFLGIISLTTSVSFISLFLPITIHVHLGILALLLIYGYFDRVYMGDAVKELVVRIRSAPYLFILGCVCLFPAILIASGPVGYHDTGMYHAQAVKWINEYGTVVGLGNLHYRLAFNSSWFYFSAFFDMLAFDGKTSHLVNLIAFTLALLVCFTGFQNIFKGDISITNILKCLFTLPICVNRFLTIVFLPSLSPDLVVVVLLLYVLILTVEYSEKKELLDSRQRESKRETYILILCISLFLPTIKLNSLPVLLFPLLILIKPENRNIKLLFASSLVGAIILLPFLVGNVLLSGYLFFPFPQIDLFGFDWKVPNQVAENVRRSIKYFAINPTLGDGIWAVANMSTSEWIKSWFARSGGKLINYWTITAFISTIIFLIICFVRRLTLCLNILVIQAILLSGIVYWFFSAPAYRFGVGWIWAFIILSYGTCIYLVLQSIGLRLVALIVRGAFVLLCIGLMNLLLIRWDSFELLSSDCSELLWSIRPLPSESMKPVQIHEGFIVNVPLKERAWNADLPSSPYVKDELQLRGNTLKEGFRLAR